MYTGTSCLYNAADYSRYSRHVRKLGFRILSENYDLIADNGFPARILDLGCKTGEVTKLLTNFANVTEILGMDRRPDMVAVAETFNGDSRIRFETGNPAEEMLPADVDGVVGMGLIDWDADIQRLLARIRHCLRPHGFFLGFLALHSTEPLQGLLNFIQESPLWKKYAQDLELKLRKERSSIGHLSLLEKAEPECVFGEQLEANGFEVSRCTLEDDAMIWKKEEATGTLPIKAFLKETTLPNEFADFYSDCCDVYLRNYFKQLTTGHYASAERVIVFTCHNMA